MLHEAVIPSGAQLADILKEVRRIDMHTRRLVDEVMVGSYLSVFRGRGIEFDTVREYAAGDDPRAVDWNVSARMGRPYVKTFVDERELPVLLLVDLSASMTGGFGIWSPRQAAARLCACLGLSAVRNGDKVGFVGFSDNVEAYVPPKKGTAHTLRIVRDCLALPPRAVGSHLAPALRFAAGTVRRRAILFVVSDFLCGDWGRALKVCARRHDVVAVRLLTPELSLPDVGLMRVRDPETGHALVLDTSSRREREAYAERVVAWRTATERDLRAARVDLMDVDLPRIRRPNQIAGPILRFFRMRQLRGDRR